MTDFKITDKSGIKLKTANKYVTEDLTVTLTDDDINNTVAENIKKGISILGVTGTFEGGITPSGKIEITNTEEVNVTNYATAQVVDSNLSAENIKKDISILGVTGTFEGGSGEDRFKKFLDTTKSANYLFFYYTGASVDDLISYNDTRNVIDMMNMFSGCSNLQSIPTLDTSNVTNMYYMFYNCNNLQTIPQLDTSKVTDMGYMFSNCRRLQTIDLTHMKIRSTSNSSSMCASCYSLTKLIIRNMDTIPVLNSNAFNNCYHFLGTVNETYNPEGLKDGRIYVPDNMVDSLKAAPNWSAFADIIVPLSTLVE